MCGCFLVSFCCSLVVVLSAVIDDAGVSGAKSYLPFFSLSQRKHHNNQTNWTFVLLFCNLPEFFSSMLQSSLRSVFRRSLRGPSVATSPAVFQGRTIVSVPPPSPSPPTDNTPDSEFFNFSELNPAQPPDMSSTFPAADVLPASTPIDVLPTLATADVLAPLSWTSHPFDGVCHMIDAIHTTADIPYFGAIMCGTIAVRSCLLPLTVTVMKNGAKMQIAAPEITKFKALLEENKNGTEEEKKAILTDMMAVYTKHNVNPLRSVLLPFFQMPIFISMFFGLQRMSDYFPDYATGGYGSFMDLGAADPSFMLPIINGLSFLLVAETNSDLDTAEHGPMMKNMFRAMAVGIPFVTASFPMVSSFYFLLQLLFSLSLSLHASVVCVLLCMIRHASVFNLIMCCNVM